MNDNSFRPNSTPTIPGHTPAKKPRRWVKPTALTAGFLATAFVGIGIGAAGSSDATATPAPAPTVTETAEPVVETVVEEVTPQSCIDAIDAADTVIDDLGTLGLTIAEYIEIIPDAYEAGLYADDTAAAQVMADMEDLNARVEGMGIESSRADYDAAVISCRELAQ